MSSNKTLVEFDPTNAPLARVTLANRRSGYVHYSTLITKLQHSLNAMANAGNVDAPVTANAGPVINMLHTPGVGVAVWPQSRIMMVAYDKPIRRVRLADGNMSKPIHMPGLIWGMKFGNTPPYRLRSSRLWLSETKPNLLSDQVPCAPWPFGNIHAHGEACWGHCRIDALVMENPNAVDAAWWDATPNDDLVRAFSSPLPAPWTRYGGGSLSITRFYNTAHAATPTVEHIEMPLELVKKAHGWQSRVASTLVHGMMGE